MRKTWSALSCAILGACGNAGLPSNTKPAQYKITEDGGAYVRDVSTYASLGEKSLTRGQKYKIKSFAEGEPEAHFLVVNVTQYYGNKKGDVGDGQMIFINDGSATYDCYKTIFDLKLTQPNDDIPNVTCKFEVIGVLSLASKAVLRSDS